mmetsp:Transcript_2309/g.3166  ORF Transcript_2309/g.3166 Transcript_2309/m.3166 type:complete len:458 (+) Transcript_2309:127-1500(+)
MDQSVKNRLNFNNRILYDGGGGNSQRAGLATTIWQSDPFQYLSFMMLFVIALYGVVLLVFLFIRRKEIRRVQILMEHQNREVLDPDSYFVFHDSTTRFYSHACRSIWSKSLRQRQTDVEEYLEARGESYSVQTSMATTFLAITRCTSLLLSLFLCIESSSTWLSLCLPLSTWNSLLTATYFLLASGLSLLGLWKGPIPRARQPLTARATELLSIAAHTMFETAAGTAGFVCVLELGLYPSSVHYIMHSSSTLFSLPMLSLLLFLLELLLNNYQVRLDQYPCSLGWVCVYLLVVWPLVYNGQLRTWPYSLLQTATAICFLQYLLLVILHLASYALFYVLFQLKLRVVGGLVRWAIISSATTTTSSNNSHSNSYGGNAFGDSETSVFYGDFNALYSQEREMDGEMDMIYHHSTPMTNTMTNTMTNSMINTMTNSSNRTQSTFSYYDNDDESNSVFFGSP